MNDCFHRALAAREHRTLGFRLRPFTLGHLFILWEADSPFVSHNPSSVTASDLAFAVYVCCHDQRKARKALGGIGARASGWLLGVLASRRNLQTECDSFCRYLGEACEAPPEKRKGLASGGGGSLATPWPWQIVALLWSRFGINRREAQAMSIAECNTLLIAEAECTGKAELLTPDDIDFVEWCKAQDQLQTAN